MQRLRYRPVLGYSRRDVDAALARARQTVALLEGEVLAGRTEVEELKADRYPDAEEVVARARAEAERIREEALRKLEEARRLHQEAVKVRAEVEQLRAAKRVVAEPETNGIGSAHEGNGGGQEPFTRWQDYRKRYAPLNGNGHAEHDAPRALSTSS